MGLKQQLRFFLAWLASVYMLSASSAVQAAELALADAPLFLGSQVSPNIFFMLDDSGSMDWEILTPDNQYYLNYWRASSGTATVTDGNVTLYALEGDCTGRDSYYYMFAHSLNTDNVYSSRCAIEGSPEVVARDWRVRNSDFNLMYYNPATTYSPWPGFADADFTFARSNPQPGTTGYSITRELAEFAYEVWIDNLGYDGDSIGTLAAGPNSVTDGANGMVDGWDSHTTYTVGSSSVDVETLTTNFAGVDGSPDCNFVDTDTNPPFVDCFGTVAGSDSLSGAEVDPWGRTVSEIQQNVANWYQYHRRRSFVMKAAVAEVMTSSASNNRFGLSLLNDYADLFGEFPLESVLSEDFPAHNEAILQALYDYEIIINGTPLRQGLERVGRYYSDYYSSDYTDPITSSCQQNFSILFTDGYWSGGDPFEAAIADEDGDAASDTLADVAHYFYNTDLSPLADEVPTSPGDQNSAQHMVSFTVAFGVEGQLVDTDNDGWPNPVLLEGGAWNNGSVTTDDEKIDDLWHAAFNSKGTFVASKNPASVATAIAEAVGVVADRVGSAASVATSTGSVGGASHLYQAKFDSGGWQGQLLAFQINLDGTINSTADWDAGSQLGAQNYASGREIITYNPDEDVIPGGGLEGQGVPFRFPADYTNADPLAEFSASQVTGLMINAPFSLATINTGEIASNQQFGEDLINYLRGDGSNEGTGQNFRSRSSVLGDIVHSAPRVVAAPHANYADSLEAKPYSAFVSANTARDGVVYVGANDGMLHGFEEATGNEILAYVPNAVYENLYRLTATSYGHRNFVDDGTNSADVYMANTNDPGTGTNGLWRTVLAGGLGGGGQAIYALNVTDPASFDEVNAASIALWEFDDSDDADLGYTFGIPQLAKMADGSWAAVFGNGYNNTEADGSASTTGHAVLYIVDVETGDLLKKIDTQAGDVGTPNGLATPLLIDTDGDSVVDYIYSGDLLGNMWKFDVSASNKSNWDIAYKQASTGIPLFTTESGQPITTQPQAAIHPDGLNGFMIYFGTGKYLETTDNTPSGQATQAFYGIWDKDGVNLTGFDSSDLLVQSITNQYAQAFDTNGDGVDDKTYDLRDVSNEVIDWDVHMGWKLDLMPDQIEGVVNVLNAGERQVSNAVVRNGRVIFTTLLPSTLPCEFGGQSYLMELDFRDGSALESPAFDMNGDGLFDADDGDASGRGSSVGIMPSVSILSVGGKDIAFGSGASGGIEAIQLSVDAVTYGRQSWRQLE
ncbi:MAG: pilus assembly protein [Pseudohongiella sp.]|nr:pilus assembly protein [Pseudohongiella sp.]